jgi:hypothetical protein
MKVGLVEQRLPDLSEAVVSTQEVLKGPRQPLKSTSRDSNDCLYDIEEREKNFSSALTNLALEIVFAWRGFCAVCNAHPSRKLSIRRVD